MIANVLATAELARERYGVRAVIHPHAGGYNDWVSLEMEDLTMFVEAGIKTSIDALKQTISQ
jgi:hypothetical protein